MVMIYVIQLRSCGFFAIHNWIDKSDCLVVEFFAWSILYSGFSVWNSVDVMNFVVRNLKSDPIYIRPLKLHVNRPVYKSNLVHEEIQSGQKRIGPIRLKTESKSLNQIEQVA